MAAVGSIVARRHLGRELRALRERAHRTREDVAATSIASVAKLARIEGGQSPVRPGDVRELCRLYGVEEGTADTLAAMAQATKQAEWWERLDGKAQRWFWVYLGLEAVASRLAVFEPMVVHGLFQTEAYAREVERATLLDSASEDFDAYVAGRLQRQEAVLARPDPPQIEIVLGEPALAVTVGTSAVMAAQLERLREQATLASVEVRVLPLSAGPHPGFHGGFTVLDFDDPRDPPIAYIETYEAARYLEASEDVARYRRRFATIHALSVPLEEYTP
ncbi:MAG: helix-turn-helix transcriptional regulator [Kineosporiaceae bacterium]|jgi:transcriptional regulator with XRE-family HTH domain